MNCGESGASSVMVALAVRNPAACGANVKMMVQVALTGAATVHVGSEKTSNRRPTCWGKQQEDKSVPIWEWVVKEL
jgi:hypothetical protein